TVEQIAAAMEEKAEEITKALEAIAEPVSLYETVYSDGGDSIYIMDQLADDNNTDESWLEDIALQEAISHLGEREQKIIRMRFYKGKTQMEIAEEIGISQAQVSRLEKGAFERIRKEM
ncbi:MAG: sigma-70 family RNA polymerase sigma factor, partial [Clostridia bacterium]|nr:sigma-70 family RNA polymerase sigma factor [Clostridia bacterium]